MLRGFNCKSSENLVGGISGGLLRVFFQFATMKARNIIFIAISILLLLYVYSSTRVHSQYVDEVKNPENVKTPVKIEPEKSSSPPEPTEPTKEEEFAEYPTLTRKLTLPSDAEISNFLKWYTELHEDEDMQRNR